MWWKSRTTGPIGLIAGQGHFPVIFAQAALSIKRPVMLFGVEGFTDKRVEPYVTEAHYVGLGELERLVGLLKEKKIRSVAFAGGVPKKRIYDPNFKLDSTAKGFISGTRNKGDDHLLRAFELFLKARCGVTVMDSRTMLKDALAPKGVKTHRKPSDREISDLKLGFKVAKHVGKMDIGQTVVIRDGVVLAVEGIEGTDQAIRRGGELGHGEVVVVKTAKPNQDLRFDLPCVGPETLESLKAVSSRVLGIEAGKTLIISRKDFFDKADREDMTVVGF